MLFIDDLLMLPFTGFNAIMRTLLKVALEQYTDDSPLKEELLQLQVQLDQGDITEDEYISEEGRILRELREVQNRKRELAGLEREEDRQPLSGKVVEGSGASITWDPEPHDK
jgi:ABC-type phosphate transport system auxiliary subunit